MTDAQVEDLFRQHRDELMRRLVGMVHSRETAADLTQETFAKVLRLVRTQVVEHPRALLHHIATNLAIDHLRKQKSPLHAGDSIEAGLEVPSTLPSQERMVLGKERFQMFMRAIESWPPRTREAFLLHRVYGYSYREVAVRMSISESGVEKHLMRALAHSCKVHDALDGEG